MNTQPESFFNNFLFVTEHEGLHYIQKRYYGLFFIHQDRLLSMIYKNMNDSSTHPQRMNTYGGSYHTEIKVNLPGNTP